MKKIHWPTVCNIISLLLLLCFFISTAISYYRYSRTLNSAPFYVWIIIHTIYYIVPAILVFLIGILIKHKQAKKA